MMPTMRGLTRLATLLAGILLVAVLSSCTASRTAVDYDPGVDFTDYRTYQWGAPEAVGLAGPEDPRVSPVARERMRLAIDQALLARGLVRESPPDFLVTLRTGLHDRQYVDTWGPWGPDPVWWRRGHRHRPFGPFGYDPFFGRTTVRTVTEGTVALDMFDAETRQPIWHGHASRVVGRDDIHPADVERMVSAVLADFPPGPPNTVRLQSASPPQ